MTQVREKSIHQQRLHELCAATARALTGDRKLHFRGRQLFRGDKRVPILAPHLRLHDELPETGALSPMQEDSIEFSDLRAVMDGIALRMRRSNADMHRELCPAEPIARLVFEMLEQLRVESCVAAYLAGLQQNLHQRFARWSRRFYHSGLIETDLGLLLFSVSQICWARLSALPLPEEIDGVIESTRANLAPMIGAALAGLKRHRDDQRAYAAYAFEIARVVDELIRAERAARAAQSEDDEGGLNDARAFAAFSLSIDVDQDDREEEDGFTRVVTGNRKLFADSTTGYRVFTTRYDVEANAAALVRAPQLKIYREQLDEKIREQGIGIGIARLARHLMAVLAIPRVDGWRVGEEEGVLDSARLAQRIASPVHPHIFKQVRETPHGDCMVSFLIDCSGSMKTHIATIAVLADIMVRALDMIGADSEILGYTTAEWNGGRARKDWLAAGQPQHPGRLNVRSHLIFKRADQRWRQARQSIGALLKPELFREGIDGEAVEWACARMMSRSCRRRILIVVTDGCPMDSATQQANGHLYLDHHLRQVAAAQERRGDIEIIGLGVGLDLSAYYRLNLGIDSDRKLDSRLLMDLLRLMAAKR
jgi:cobaltochelatase CobT